MEDQESINPNQTTDYTSRKKVSPYDLLMRQSRKMGSFATQTFDVTREFLKKDVSTIHPDKLLFGRAVKESATNDDPRDKNTGEASKREDEMEKARFENSDREIGERGIPTVDRRESLRRIVRKSHQTLAGAQTVILPINLFPDTVIVDRTKVTITKRTFFWTSSVISFRIEDVLNVACSTGPIFGSLTISSRVMNSTDHYEIDYFWRKDAQYLKQIIQGYVIAQHNQIETSHLSRKDLINTLLELGSDSQF